MDGSTNGRAANGVADPWPDADWKRQLRRRLLRWYRQNARPLPWRVDRDPYRVWVSEVMLQQTTVAAVTQYFNRFMSALPTVTSLAAADEQQVLRLWEGLGYYRRARQLHRAAKIVVGELGGQFPSDADTVRRLPGIGRYTAGAILSIAFDQPAPILEANTVRLLSRLLKLDADPTTAATQKVLWQGAEALLVRRGAGELNQALMELGGQVCRPREPLCLLCPLAAICPTFAAGLQDKIPAPRKKPTLVETCAAAIVVFRRGRVLLIKRRQGERWAGLWDFPRFELANGAPLLARRANVAKESAEIADRLRDQIGVAADALTHLATLRHGVTRFRITLDCYSATAEKIGRRSSGYPERVWVSPRELAEYPLNSTGRKIANLLLKGAGPKTQPTSLKS